MTPAVELVLVGLVSRPLGRLVHFFFPKEPFPSLGILFLNLYVALALSMALGFWESWKYPQWEKRLGMGLVFGFAIAFVNACIGFAGCAAMGGVF